jgi:hypothetical protein
MSSGATVKQDKINYERDNTLFKMPWYLLVSFVVVDRRIFP